MLFSKIDVNKVEWLNLVFENRNHSYGAYVLRRDSGNYLLKSLMITGFLFGGAVLLSTINSKSKLADPIISALPIIKLDDVRIIPVEIITPKPESASADVSAPAVNLEKPDLQTVKFSGKLNPVNDDLVVTEVPTIKQIEESVVGLQDNTGISAGTTNNESSLGGGTADSGTGLANGTEVYGTELLEVMPEFPGGMKAWASFLTKNLNYPRVAAENGISGKVIVSFVIEKNGALSDLKVIKGIGGGCDEEAMRVIKRSPFWKAGMQNGNAVRVAYMMPVVFRME